MCRRSADIQTWLPLIFTCILGFDWRLILRDALLIFDQVLDQDQVLHFRSCSMNQSYRRKKLNAIWPILTKVITFFVQLIQVIDSPLNLFDSANAKACNLNSFYHRASKPTIFFHQYDVFTRLIIFCQFQVVKSSKKIPIPPAIKQITYCGNRLCDLLTYITRLHTVE